MKRSDPQLNDLDVLLQEDERKASDRDTSVNIALGQTDAIRADAQQAPETLGTLRKRLQEKEEQLRALQRELRLRDERIAQLERLNAEGHAKTHDMQSVEIAAMGLVLESVNGPGVMHRISRITTTIGRAGNNDVVLNNTSVSRSHARIVVASDSTYLIDLRSSNGCSVNGERISRKMISDGDIVAFGDVQFRFATGVPASEAETRWMDETQAMLDESVVFSRAPTLTVEADDNQAAESTAQAK